LSTTEASERQALIEEIRIRRAIKDREYAASCPLWAHEQVRTVDEATQKLRRWPDDKPYLDELFDLYESEQLIALPKSRRLLVTWSVALWMTWRCRYHPYNAAYIQSDEEAKSAYVVDRRCKFIEDNLAEDWCKRPYHPIRTKNGMVGRLTYDGTASYIHGVAEGPDKIRSYTPSIIALDECEFQEGAHAALVAIMALVEGNKNVTCILISTSNGPQGILAGICKEVGFVKWS
jgi:hypothetical protein